MEFTSSVDKVWHENLNATRTLESQRTFVNQPVMKGAEGFRDVDPKIWDAMQYMNLLEIDVGGSEGKPAVQWVTIGQAMQDKFFLRYTALSHKHSFSMGLHQILPASSQLPSIPEDQPLRGLILHFRTLPCLYQDAVRLS